MRLKTAFPMCYDAFATTTDLLSQHSRAFFRAGCMHKRDSVCGGHTVLPFFIGGKMLESNGKTVLVVDDEEGIRKFLTRLLSSLGFRVISAKRTKAAKGYISEADIVISDIRIGDENGIEFLQYLREQGVDKPFLLMSGDPSPNENEMAIELTGHPVLFKPNIMRELPSIINKISPPC